MPEDVPTTHKRIGSSSAIVSTMVSTRYHRLGQCPNILRPSVTFYERSRQKPFPSRHRLGSIPQCSLTCSLTLPDLGGSLQGCRLPIVW